MLFRYPLVFTLLGCILLLSVSPLFAGEQNPERVIARVNDVPITAGELEWQWRRQLRQAAPGGLVTVAPPVGREDLLESLIRREILYQEAVNAGWKPNGPAAMKKLAALKSQFRSEAAFSRELQELGVNEMQLLKELTRSEMIRDFLDVRFIRAQKVTEEEAQAWYREHAGSLGSPDKVCAAHILKAVADEEGQSGQQRVRREIGELRKRFLAGEDFAELARKHSDCPSREQGGDLGCFTFVEMVRPFSEVAFALAAGEISEPVVTDDGVHLILVREHQVAELPAFDNLRSRALQEVRAAKAGPQIKEFLDSRRAAARVEIIP
ncbi:MAG: peptidylprolyl isomerase [Syntrophotaleaceae bacterium]